jgi:hypothetical protein
MPLHDWTDERGWDSVHQPWLTYILEFVQERLPEGYRAFLGGVPAVSIDSGNGKPDITVRQWGPAPVRENTAVAVLEPDAEAKVSFRLDPQRAVHVLYHGRLVASLELVSPRNKDRTSSKDYYTNRYIGYLLGGAHLLLVDVLPRPRNFSFADAIKADVGLDAPPLPPPFAVTFRVGEVVPVGDDMGSLLALWQRPLTVGQPLPTLPLPLNVHEAINVDLEETYRRAAKRAYLD